MIRKAFAVFLALSMVVPARAETVWSRIDARLHETLRLAPQVQRTELFRARAAEILRDDPSLTVEPALGRAFAEAYRIDGKAERAATRLLTDGLSAAIAEVGPVYHAALFDGRMHIASETGLYVMEEDGKAQRLIKRPTYHVAEVKGRRYAGTLDGLYREENGTWRRLWLNTDTIGSIAETAGTAYASGRHGLFRDFDEDRLLPEPGFEDPISGSTSQVFKTLSIDGVLHACTARGLFAWAGEWRRLFPANSGPVEVLDAAKIDGRLHLATFHGLLVENASGGFDWAIGKRTVNAIAALGTERFLLVGGLRTKQGAVYSYEDGAWKERLSIGGDVHALLRLGGRLFLATALGLLPWEPNLLPPGWQDRVLEDLDGTIGRRGDPREKKQTGTVLDRRGRSLFSGLATKIGLALGSPRLAFAAPNEDVWSVLERWVIVTLEIPRAPAEGRSWRELTVDLLRSSPHLGLEEALAQSFGERYGLASSEVKGMFLRHALLESLPGTKVDKLIRNSGGLYAFTQQGLYRLEGSRWVALAPGVRAGYGVYPDGDVLLVGDGENVYEVDENRVTKVIEGLRHFGPLSRAGGNTFLGTGGFMGSASGLYEKVGKRWHLLAGTEVMGATGRVEIHDHKLYVAARNGLYRYGEDRLVRSVLSGLGESFSLIRRGDALYARTWRHEVVGNQSHDDMRLYRIDDGTPTRLFEGQKVRALRELGWLLFADVGKDLYELTPGGWKQAFRHEKQILSTLSFRGEIYAQADDGVYRRAGGAWSKVLDRSVWLGDTLEREGETCVATGAGLYKVVDHQWSLLLPEVHIHGLADGGRFLYVGTDEGVKRLPLASKELPEDWKERLLADVSADLSANPKTAAAPSAGESPLKRADGRSLLSGLMGRFGLALGGPRLGFAAEDDATPWRPLGDWIRQAFAVELDAGALAAWRASTADLLRSHPQLSLERGLARGLAAVTSVAADAAEALFLFERTCELHGVGGIYNVLPFEDKLYAETHQGLYARGSDGWRPLENPLDPKNAIRHIFAVDGKFIAATHNGHFGLDERGWYHDAIPYLVWLHDLARVGTRLYAGSKNGLHVLKEKPLGHGIVDQEWQTLFDKQVYKITPWKQRLYLATDSGLWAADIPSDGSPLSADAFVQVGEEEQDATPWAIPNPSAFGLAHDAKNWFWGIQWVGKEVYALTAAGLYRREGSLWRRIYEAVGGIWEHGDARYVEKEGLWRQRPAPANLPADWRGELLADIAPEIARRRGSPQEPGLKRKDGRSLFSGLMSRVSLALGGPRLGFSTSEDAWERLERRVAEEFSLGREPSRVREWRDAAAASLRDHPGLTLEAALAATFPPALAWPQEKRRALADWLLGRPLQLSDKQTINDIAWIDGVLHVAALEGAYVLTREGLRQTVFEGTRRFRRIAEDWCLLAERGIYRHHGAERAWIPEKVPSPKDPRDFVRIADVSYYADLMNLWRRSDAQRAPEPVFAKEAAVHRFMKLDGIWHAGAAAGLYRHENGNWNLVDPTSNVLDAAKIGGMLFLATPLGIYYDGRLITIEGESPRSASFSRIDGVLYAAGVDGKVYRTAIGQRWTFAAEFAGARLIRKLDGLMHWVTMNGLWREADHRGLPKGWRGRLTEDLAASIAEKPASRSSSTREILVRKDGRSLMSELGRLLFGRTP